MLTQESAARKDERTGIATMEHRHFATVATILKRLKSRKSTRLTSDMVAHFFADALGEINPKFDRKRFLRACDASETPFGGSNG